MIQKLSQLVLFAAISVVAISSASAQINSNDIIISEFFDDILKVGNGTVTDIFDVAQSDNITSIAIADSSTAYVVNFGEVWKVDFNTNLVTTLAALSGTSSSEITMDLNGDLLAVNASHGIRRIDTGTGAISQVYDDTFFGADDIVVSSEGYIYTTEFFDGLGRVNPDGSWTRIGNWDTNFFSHLDLGPDGFLYLSTTFEGGDIYRVNPTTGNGELLADDVFTFIDDLQVAADGTIYLAGATDIDDDNLVEDLVMAIDPTTGVWNVVVDESMVGDPGPPFFNPMDIDIFNGRFYASAVPEPGSAMILAMATVGLAFCRRRQGKNWRRKTSLWSNFGCVNSFRTVKS